MEIEFTDKPITPYGGIVLIKEYFNKVGLKCLLEEALPQEGTSPMPPASST